MTRAAHRPPAVEGDVAAGFEPVLDAFAANLRDRGELGGAVACVVDGETVVDVWGGRAGPGREPWQRDTPVVVFSACKGMAATTMAVAHSRGLFDLDAPVAAYWPAFGAAGKGEISVRDLLRHRAGLPAVDARLTPELVADRSRLDEVLARQEPLWEPGRAQGYHTYTLGWYQDALLRRVDPAGRGIDRYFHDEVAAPLGLTAGFGAFVGEGPPPADLRRVPLMRWLTHSLTHTPLLLANLLTPGTLTYRSARNPPLLDPREITTPAWRAADVPSATGIATARDLARLYAELAAGGPRLGLAPGTFAEISAPTDAPPAGRRDLVLHFDAAYGFGFHRSTARFPFGSDERAFGAPGLGGSFGFADPARRMGYAYVTCAMGPVLVNDARELALREEVAAGLRG